MKQIYTNQDDHLLSTGQAARFLSIAVGTLQNWRYQGIGPQFIKHRRSVYYRLADLNAYVDENFKTYKSTSEAKADRLK